MTNWDDNDLGNIQEENLRYFYEEFSASVRRQLMSKNLLAPQNVYDVLYIQKKQELLAKNVVKITDLEESSKSIRDALISKLISNNIDLEKISENTRNSLLSRNKIIQEANDLLNNSFSVRKGSLSKNVSSTKDILKDSDAIRQNNISANNENISFKKNIDSNSEEFRINNISKNKENSGDLLGDSQEFLKNNITANVENIKDLLDDSQEFLKNNTAANINGNGDLLGDSATYLINNEASNIKSVKDLLDDSQEFLKNNIGANTKDTGDLLGDSHEFLKNNTAANIKNSGDLLTDSKEFLNNNISTNKSDVGDLLTDSQPFLANNTSVNVPSSEDLLIDSQPFLANNTSVNVPSSEDLLTDSQPFLANNTSVNVPSSEDLLTDSQPFLAINTSVNVPSSEDLLIDSQPFLANNLSLNVQSAEDLLTDSLPFLVNNTSANISSSEDLLTDSQSFLANNLAPNVPSTEDLATDSIPFLANNLAPNVPSTEDLATDSQPFLINNLAPNVPSSEDLLTDSILFLTNNLAPNVPSTEDLFTDSQPFLTSNLAPNVPSSEDLLTDSQPFLANNISANVPSTEDLIIDSQPFLANNLAPNVPSTEDLATDSIPFLANNLASNIPANSNLQSQSSQFRDDNLAANVQNHFDVLSYSNAFRINNLSKNPPSNPLGVVIEGLGTSTFLGVSKVLTQGIILRQLLFTKNKFQINKSEYTSINANLVRGNGVAYPNSEGSLTTKESIQNQLDRIYFFNDTTASNLQNKYGTNNSNSISVNSIGGGFYSTSKVLPKGGWFDEQNAPKKVIFNTKNSLGSITDAIRNYNLSRNLYNLQNLSKTAPGDFHELMLLGNFKGNNNTLFQQRSNLISSSISVSDGDAYLGKNQDTGAALRAESGKDGMSPVLGSPESMMAKTVPGNPLEDAEFQAGTKGVRYIINAISKGASDISKNYVIGSRKFAIGMKSDGKTPRIATQRFSMTNPYNEASKPSKTLIFHLQNYSSNQSFYFPPYIQSYSDSYGANWNSINFLGRPEPVFTYNNSTREGTISFIVLTDYTQSFVIGSKYDDSNGGSFSDIIIDSKTNLIESKTGLDYIENEKNNTSKNSNKQREAQKQKIIDSIKEKEAHKKETAESSSTTTDIDALKKTLNSLDKEIENSSIKSNGQNKYYESNSTITSSEDGIENEARIKEMIATLAFQPAFFSGDKIDFQRKIDFLAKLTRPASADHCSGFSFTKPPVCHIKLGDWWDNDIVVDNVNFNYDDVPWTLDDNEGRVQPMWAVVNMNFKFIGPYRGQSGDPVLSDDQGGLYWTREAPAKDIK